MSDAAKFQAVGLALVLAALILGFTPVTVGNMGWGGDGFECGSAFVSSDKLTDYGHETCLINGGGANRRITAFALLGAGLVLLLAPIVFRARRAALSAPQKDLGADPPSPTSAAGQEPPLAEGEIPSPSEAGRMVGTTWTCYEHEREWCAPCQDLLTNITERP